MKTFYIFKISESYINIAKKTPNNIFILLNSIYRHKKSDIDTAFNLFNEICLPINTEFFNDYMFKKLKMNEEYTKFKNTHMYYNYFTDEVSKMIVKKSHIKIKSNINDNIFNINLYDLGNLFICDFNNNYYNYFLNKRKIKSNKFLVN